MAKRNSKKKAKRDGVESAQRIVDGTVELNETQREYLNSLKDEDGVLTVAAVLAAARDEASPIHHLFEWDDAIAAEALRWMQAATLIRGVKRSKPGKPGGETVWVPESFVSGKKCPGGRYRPIDSLSEVEAAMLMAKEMKNARGHMARCRDLADRVRYRLPDGLADALGVLIGDWTSLRDAACDLPI